MQCPVQPTHVCVPYSAYISIPFSNISLYIMEEAFELAERALNAAEVPVGCAFIYRNEVIASGRNEVNASGDATQHAEIVAIKRLEQWCEENGKSLEIILPETILHVTVEPCIMCAAALRFSLPAHPKW